MSIEKSIQKLREQIQQLKEEIEWVAEAPVTREEWKERVASWVDGMAAKADRTSSALLSLRSANPLTVRDADLLAIQASVAQVAGMTTVRSIDFSIAPHLTWLLGDAIKASMLAKVEAMDYVPGLPLAERPARLAQLKQDLRALEEKEEALICEAEANHMPIYRRSDADPAVVLNYDPKGTMNEPASRKVYASSAPLPEASPEFVAHQAAQSMAAAQYDAINATARMNQQVAAYAQAVKATAK
ncbi:hypothetical protein FYM52_16685 [Comamonas sp. CAH-2]|uniref:hypothetical protein n=1 Tax=Comamonas sp. CAH-2 TaxID=2605745 RepID=UPI0012ADA984|nr:hypothetical protein [Comamonas sp. CAH-2]MRT21970.1 hypothetical protein [Comamonas sp. CAH-2]